MTSDGGRTTDLPTHTANLAAPSPPGRGVRSPDTTPVRFAPGTMLGQRFRIIGLLGTGGMGEVYRADDLVLGQAVALKFLPPAIVADARARERLFAEVRMARQVSHPNVCRVFDIGDVPATPDGPSGPALHFLSMEYIDGEDLASLITRIGHLPPAKVLEIAHQLCAGLAAAHARGVLHRDLKPRNVMIDGRGHARITDFGLAVAIDRPLDHGTSPGTPVYMAPELLLGHGATVRSDIYALGLVLYELTVGRHPFRARNLDELRAEKLELVPAPPSELGRDLDPRVERTILRCLERDPASRPISASHVAAMLPGRDPLSTALAAGDTPSPEMVAAATTGDRLSRSRAAMLIALLVLSTVATIWIGTQSILTRRAPLQRPPDALAERARTIVHAAGYRSPPADRQHGIAYDDRFLASLEARTQAPDRWSHLSPHAVRFWYRQSAQPLRRLAFSLGVSPRVTLNDPPLGDAGDVAVILNGAGTLLEIVGVAPAAVSASAHAEPDWPALFRDAGLNIDQWRESVPESTPMFWADRRVAWEPVAAVSPPRAAPMRVEAASVGPAVTSFQVMYPWSAAGSRPGARLFYDLGFGASDPGSTGHRVATAVGIALTGLAMFGGLIFARRNLRLGRGDRRGATRLAVFVAALLAASWLLDEHHVAGAHEWYLVVSFAGRALVLGAIVWWTYVAFEPYVRRQWPGQLVSWSRVLAGNVTDPLVGRDLLIGGTAGAAITAILLVSVQIPGWFGASPEHLAAPTWHAWLGPRHAVSLGAQLICNALLDAFSALFVVVLTRLVIRRELAAAAVAAALLATTDALLAAHPIFAGAVYFVVFFSGVLVLIRVGLLAVIALRFTVDLLQAYPIVLDSSAWYASLGLAALVTLAAMVVFATRAALGPVRAT
jgi:serine/threonine-protein kinase